ncbi:MAG: FAD/NAD(P)-binding protein [Pseudomonadota bacterium]
MLRMDTDYLVVGAGASAMSFVDILLDMTDAEVVMVDKRAQPCGDQHDGESGASERTR